MEEEIQGIIGPVDWDQQGNIIAIALFGWGEKQYLISNDLTGKELFNHNGSLVKVVGHMLQDSQRREIFIVQKYELL